MFPHHKDYYSVMKATLIVLISSTLLMSHFSFAQNKSEETRYYCPSIRNIKFSKGIYYAHTSYNGKSVDWADDSDFFPRENKISTFMKAIVNSGANSYTVRCNYKLDNDDQILTLEMLYGNVVTKTGNGSWDADKNCIGAQPEQCEFYIS